jgi:hypothetical protein
MPDDDVALPPVVSRALLFLGASFVVGLVGAIAVLVAAAGPGNARRAMTAGDELPSNATFAAFLRPRAERDEMPAVLVRSVRGLAGDEDVPDVLRNGAMDPGQSRLLFGGVGPVNGGLYAFRSARGRICYALEGGPQSCHTQFSLERPSA